jgi:hypothetical protein
MLKLIKKINVVMKLKNGSNLMPRKKLFRFLRKWKLIYKNYNPIQLNYNKIKKKDKKL